MIPVISFVGYSNNGKTTVLVNLVRRLKQRGYRVAVIKHDVHSFVMDVPGKDSWRHTDAGADVVYVSSPGRLASIQERRTEMPLNSILAQISGVDIIFTEGYKRENMPKIEVFRKAAGHQPLGQIAGLIAVVADAPVYEGVRQFSFDQVDLLTDFLETAYLGKPV